MKKIIIGTLVGTAIFFAYQTIMWVGGFHSDFSKYTPEQETVLNCLNENLNEDGMYILPSVDPSVPDRMQAEQELMNNSVGKPWAMIFYHKSMSGMEASYLMIGIFYTFIATLIVCLVLYYGKFSSFKIRFLIAMSYAFFTLSQGALDDMNWWTFPWSFVKTEVIDLTLGWVICSLWLAAYVKK